jgi:hypothetical protein
LSALPYFVVCTPVDGFHLFQETSISLPADNFSEGNPRGDNIMKNIRVIISVIALLLIVTVIGCDGGATDRTEAGLNNNIEEDSGEPTGGLFGDSESENYGVDECDNLSGELELIAQDNAELKAKLKEMQVEVATSCDEQQCDLQKSSRYVNKYELNKSEYETCFYGDGDDDSQSFIYIEDEVEGKIKNSAIKINAAEVKQEAVASFLEGAADELSSDNPRLFRVYVSQKEVLNDSAYSACLYSEADGIVDDVESEIGDIAQKIDEVPDGLKSQSEIEAPNAEQIWVGEEVEATSLNVKSDAYPEIIACGGVGPDVAAMRAENDALVEAIGALTDQVDTCGDEQSRWCKLAVREEYLEVSSEYKRLVESCREANILFNRVNGDLADILGRFAAINDMYKEQSTACDGVESEFEEWKFDNIVTMEDAFKSTDYLGAATPRNATFSIQCPPSHLLTGIKSKHNNNVNGIHEIRCREWKQGEGLVGNHKWYNITYKRGGGGRSKELTCDENGFAVRNIYGTNGWTDKGRKVVGSLALECAKVGPEGLVLMGNENASEERLQPISYFTKKIGKIESNKKLKDWYKEVPGPLHRQKKSCAGGFCAHWQETFYKASCDRRDSDGKIIAYGIARGIYGRGHKRVDQLGLQCTHFRNQNRHAVRMPKLMVDENTDYWSDNNERQAASADQIESVNYDRNELVMVGMRVERQVLPGLPAHLYQPIFKSISRLYIDEETRNLDHDDAVIASKRFDLEPRFCATAEDMTESCPEDTFSCPLGHAVTGIHHYEMAKFFPLKIVPDAILLRCSPVLPNGKVLIERSAWTGMKKVKKVANEEHFGSKGHDKKMQRCSDEKNPVVVGLRVGKDGSYDIRSMCTSIETLK